jgi:hypothetical protein
LNIATPKMTQYFYNKAYIVRLFFMWLVMLVFVIAALVYKLAIGAQVNSLWFWLIPAVTFLRMYLKYLNAANKHIPALIISNDYIYLHALDKKLLWDDIKAYRMYEGYNQPSFITFELNDPKGYVKSIKNPIEKCIKWIGYTITRKIFMRLNVQILEDNGEKILEGIIDFDIASQDMAFNK